MFIALQVIDLDTNEVLGYIGKFSLHKNLTPSLCVYIDTKARRDKWMKFIADLGMNYLTGKGWPWEHWREELNIKEHPFIRFNLVEYELKEVSNTMLVQVLDMGTK